MFYSFHRTESSISNINSLHCSGGRRVDGIRMTGMRNINTRTGFQSGVSGINRSQVAQGVNNRNINNINSQQNINRLNITNSNIARSKNQPKNENKVNNVNMDNVSNNRINIAQGNGSIDVDQVNMNGTNSNNDQQRRITQTIAIVSALIAMEIIIVKI